MAAMLNSLTVSLVTLTTTALLLGRSGQAAYKNQFYSSVPAQYRRLFENGDRFSAIVKYVNDVRRSPQLACNVRGRLPLTAFQSDSPADRVPASYAGFEDSQRSILSIANLFNYIYQLANRPFEQWFAETLGSRGATYDAFWYSVVSSVVASDKRVFGCYVVLFRNRSHTWDTIPHAYRGADGGVVINNYAHEVSAGPEEPGFEWLAHHHRSYDRLVRKIGSRPSQTMTPDLDMLLFPFTSGLLKSSGGVKVVTELEAFWGPPVFICGPAGTLNRWLFSYAVPFLNGSGSSLGIKGWLILEFDLNLLEINQCANESTFRSFYSNDICNQATTECSHIPGMGFTDENFICKCKKYFHHGNFTGDSVRAQYALHVGNNASNYTGFECGPCPLDCPTSCTTDGRCLIKYDLDTLRALPLVVQTFCVTVCLLVAGIVFKARKNRIIKSAVWILLEIFLVGVTLLYTTVFLMYLQPSYEICFAIPWFREIGFAVTYGTLLVKIYRILCSFRSRKAHRVHVRDRDLLKYLTAIVVVAFGFMAAWTAATVDHGRRLTSSVQSLDCGQDFVNGQLILEDGRLADRRLGFRVCAVGSWEAVCATAELSFLALGLFYCYCVRSAPTDCHETRCITVAFGVELVVSLGYHIARHFMWNTMHPDYLYLMYFARCQLTVTVTAALVLGPRLWFVHSPPKNANNRSTMYSQVGGHLGETIGGAPVVPIGANGDVDVEVNIADMNPEDIRAELKRLYTQLEIFKTKVMRKENPHISRRKGGRKQTHRRFSLQPFYHKHSSSSHKQPQQQQQQQQTTTASVQEEEISKVSEDSSNSAEGADTDRSSGRESGTGKGSS